MVTRGIKISPRKHQAKDDDEITPIESPKDEIEIIPIETTPKD